jgi:hypothetical protein
MGNLKNDFYKSTNVGKGGSREEVKLKSGATSIKFGETVIQKQTCSLQTFSGGWRSAMIWNFCEMIPWQNSSRAHREGASLEILRILWDRKVHYRIHKSPPFVAVLRQIDPVHASHPTFWKSIIILPSTSVSSKWASSLRCPHQNGVRTSNLASTYYMHCPFYCTWHHHSNSIWGVQNTKLLVM